MALFDDDLSLESFSSLPSTLCQIFHFHLILIGPYLFCKFWSFDWRIDKALSYFLSGEPSRDCHAWSFFGDLCASLWPPRYRGLTPASAGQTGDSYVCLSRTFVSDCTFFPGRDIISGRGFLIASSSLALVAPWPLMTLLYDVPESISSI